MPPGPSHTTGHAGPHPAVQKAALTRILQFKVIPVGEIGEQNYSAESPRSATPYIRFLYVGLDIHYALLSVPAPRPAALRFA